MLRSITLVAFDQHAATTVAAVLLPGHRTPALHRLTSDTGAIRLGRADPPRGPIPCCYESGRCGFEWHRALTGREIPCDVIAPA
jgi:hypothetical protein